MEVSAPLSARLSAAQPPVPSAPALLALRGVRQVFPGVVALDEVHLDLYAGRVHGLMGENGAGKSTIIKILSGTYPPTAGQILLRGEPITFRSASDAQSRGVRTIHQELSLVPMLSIAENIYAGALPTRAGGLVDRRRLHDQTRAILGQLGLPHSPDTLVGELSLAQQQLVEIGRALAYRADVLILDEPTSSLTEREVETLFRIVRELQARGTAILYVSHKMSEIFDLCDEVTVLRDGRYVGHAEIGDITEDGLVRLMAGRDVQNAYPPRGTPGREVTLRVSGLTGVGVGPCSFEVHRGEIVGFYGLVGAGRTELARLLFGADPATGGSVELDGQTLRIRSTQDAVAAHIGYVTEDRKSLGVFLDFDVAQNVAAAAPGRVRRGLWHDAAAERTLADTYISQLRVKTSGPEQLLSTLSGGNQQKVLIAKWLAIDPRVLIVDEPTRGIDVSAKAEIHRLLRRFADGGMAVIVISSELPEVMGVSNRVLVMHEGRITAELDPEAATPEDLLRAASGLNSGPDSHTGGLPPGPPAPTLRSPA